LGFSVDMVAVGGPEAEADENCFAALAVVVVAQIPPSQT